jgi:hypothetical protein
MSAPVTMWDEPALTREPVTIIAFDDDDDAPDPDAILDRRDEHASNEAGVRTVILRELLKPACAKLYQVAEGSALGWDELVSYAADLVYTAGKLLPCEHRWTLFRISTELRELVNDAWGAPGDAALDKAQDDIERVIEALEAAGGER